MTPGEKSGRVEPSHYENFCALPNLGLWHRMLLAAMAMATAETRTVWEGLVVAGKFPLRKWLGGSVHSTVFLTERQELASQASQKAAIKLIAADGWDAERQLSRWRAAAQLSHPHLLRIFEAGRCQLSGSPFVYLVMEYAEEDLSQILPERPLTPDEVADLLPPVLDALSYLHGKGFVHGRIKPSNVVAVGEQLKLSAEQAISLAETESRPRRDVYDAPETAAGVISTAADVWSLGITLVAAFTQKTSPDIAEQMPGLLVTMPNPFRGIARECLRPDPKQRCSLAQIQARLQPEARSVPAEPEPPLPPTRHYRYSWRMLIPIAVLLVFGLGAYFFHRVFASRGSASGAKIVVAPGPTQTRSSAPSAAASAQGNAEARVLHQVLPDVPQSALNTITGTVRVSVRVNVDSSGKVTAAELASAGPSKYFARLALNAAQGWQFAPPQINGQPPPSTWLLHFRFRQTSIQASADRVRR